MIPIRVKEIKLAEGEVISYRDGTRVVTLRPEGMLTDGNPDTIARKVYTRDGNKWVTSLSEGIRFGCNGYRMFFPRLNNLRAST